jgi:hypothetical protein
MSTHLSVDLSASYEALRAHAVGGLPAESPRGLAIVVNQGLPAWIRAWAAPPPVSSAPVLASGSGGTSVGLGAEVVRLLTEMALGSRREVAIS